MGTSVYVHDDAVDITFSGVDRWATLSAGLHLPLADVTDARVAPVADVEAERGWRILGTHWPRILRLGNGWPGTVTAGHFRDRQRTGARQLWAVYGDDEVLVIDTRRERPCRVVLQVPDRADLAWLIGERLPART